jgi:hypothetical protein
VVNLEKKKECMVIKKSRITNVVDLGKTQSAAALWPGWVFMAPWPKNFPAWAHGA